MGKGQVRPALLNELEVLPTLLVRGCCKVLVGSAIWLRTSNPSKIIPHFISTSNSHAQAKSDFLTLSIRNDTVWRSQ